MGPVNFVLVSTLVANLGLGIYILHKNFRGRVNQFFAYFIFSIAFWTICTYLLWISKGLSAVLFWGRMTFVGPALIPIFFLCFILVFPEEKLKLNFLKLILLIGPGVFFSIISPTTDWIVKSLTVSAWINPVYGLLYPWFAVYFVTYMIFGFYLLVQKLLRAKGREKLQLTYVLLGALVSAILGTFFSLALPLLGQAQFDFYGPPSTLIMVCFISYVIVRYQLLGIEDFLSRGTIFLAVTSAVIGTLYLIAGGDYKFILPFNVIVLNLFLGLFVLQQNFKSPINLSFGGLTLSLASWSLFIYLFHSTYSGPLATLWSRATFVGPSFAAAFLLTFSLFFPGGNISRMTGKLILVFLPALFLAAFSFTNFIVVEVLFSNSGYKLVYGVGHKLFAVYFLVCVCLAFTNLFQKYKNSFGIAKMQLRYVFWGMFFTTLIAVITNLILPLLSGYSLYSWIGPSSTIILVSFTAYAIVKYRLLNIDVLIQRGLIYTVVILLITVTYVVVVLSFSEYLKIIGKYHPALVTLLAAFIIALTFKPFLDLVQTATDRVFFRKKYNYQRTLGELSKAIASIIKIKRLSYLLVNDLVFNMKVEKISILLLDRHRENFKSVNLDDLGENSSLNNYCRIEIDKECLIISWLNLHKTVLVLEEVKRALEKRDSKDQQRIVLENLRDEMIKIGFDVYVPLLAKEELIGILVLGGKLSGEMYTDEDLRLLMTLANQVAVGVENALLYEEILGMKNYTEEILHSMTSAVFTTDLEGRIITFNKMAAQITGVAPPLAYGRKVEELWGPKNLLSQLIRATLAGKTYKNFETTLVNPNLKTSIAVNINTILLEDRQGQNRGVLGIVTDLSGVKELEHKVRQSDKLVALGTMAAGMAHEIKNPLASMKVLSQLMSKKFQDEEFRRKFIEIMPREIGRIDRIVGSLLGFARATRLQLKQVKIEDLIEEALRFLEEQIESGKITVEKQFLDLPPIILDEQQITQVFVNLFLNAFQAMPEGGTLKIITRPASLAEDQSLKTIEVEVIDTGHGISKEYLNKLFDPFFTTKHGGTGLGLSIVHSIIEGHNGIVSAESPPAGEAGEVGKGTKFKIILPVKQT